MTVPGKGPLPAFSRDLLALAGISEQNSLTLGAYPSPFIAPLTPNLPGRGRTQTEWSGSSCFDKIYTLGPGINGHSYMG